MRGVRGDDSGETLSERVKECCLVGQRTDGLVRVSKLANERVRERESNSGQTENNRVR